MRNDPDDDDADELDVFAAMEKRTAQLGMAPERTVQGYRLDGHGATVHWVDLDGVAEVLKDRPAHYLRKL